MPNNKMNYSVIQSGRCTAMLALNPVERLAILLISPLAFAPCYFPLKVSLENYVCAKWRVQ